MGQERVDQDIQLAFQDSFELVNGQADAVVGDAKQMAESLVALPSLLYSR